MTNWGQKRGTDRWKKYSISNKTHWINFIRASRWKVRENKYPQNYPFLNIWKRHNWENFYFYSKRCNQLKLPKWVRATHNQTKKSFKITQKSNLNYLHSSLFAPEAKLNSFFLSAFHALWCVRLFTANLKYRISHKFAILKIFVVPFLYEQTQRT